MPLLGKVPLTMPLREQADAGVPLVDRGPRRPRRAGDPPRRARPDRARPAELPVLPLVEVGAGPMGSDQPAESRKPVGMSLPMA